MKIVELRAENVKRLLAVQVKPDGSPLVVVGGKNGAGKSSLLDSIVYALNGAASLPGRPVRKGEEKAEIEIKLDGGLVVRRRINENGKTDLEIKQTDADGVTSKVTKPQDLLNSLCGTIAFDPLAFTRLRPQEQVDMLRKLVGVEVSDLDSEAKRVFDERTSVNRDVKGLESQIAAAQKFDDAPESEVAMADALAAVEIIRQHNESVRQQQLAFERAERTHVECQRHLKDAEARVERIKAELAEAQQHVKACDQDVSDAFSRQEKARESVGSTQDDSEAVAALSTVEETNRKVRANKVRDALVERYKAAQEQAADLTGQLEQLRDQRIKRLSEAKWPVKGLGFAENGVTYQSLPFDQCSSAEQLRISTAIGLAQHPKLRVLLIRDASLLDEDNLAAIAEMADEHDAQVWCERVGKGQECSVIIEDGSVLKKAEPVTA